MANESESSRTKFAPRIAFSGEEYGFGYKAAEKFIQSNALRSGASRHRLGDDKEGPRADWTKAQRQPLRTKEQSLLAVKTGRAHTALVPLHAPYSGYDLETLRTLASLPGLLAYQTVAGDDKLCLAVHESQVLELVQSSHPTSALSTLLNSHRRSWDERMDDPGNTGSPIDGALPRFSAGLKIDTAAQLMLRDRIDSVYANLDARSRCQTKINGLKSAGVDFVDTPNAAEPHRIISREVRSTLNPNRQTQTVFDPRSGATMSSVATAEPQTSQLYGVILPFEIANMSHDYIIVDPDMDDSDPKPTSFIAVKSYSSKTLVESMTGSSGARANAWMKEFKKIREDNDRVFDGQHDRETEGLRVLLKIDAAGAAECLGDLAVYLQKNKVRHSIIMNGDDTGAHRKAAHFVDIEFTNENFESQGVLFWQSSVARVAMEKAFSNHWKARGVQVLGAMPIAEFQHPEIKARAKNPDRA